MTLNLRKAVVDRLAQHPGAKMTARELANWIYATFPDACAQKLANSSWIESEKQLLTQIVSEIGANRPDLQKKHPQIKTTAERPRRYYWSDVSDEAAVQEAEVQGLKSDETGSLPIKEAALYERLVKYLRAEFGLFSLRIDEKKSSNKKGPQGNKWLYPDVCALEDLTATLHADIKQLLDLAGGRKARLWSFEVKLLLNASNVREAFFQAVSNSSWSNFGYLVALEIDPKVESELRMLHGLHGIGIIQLDADDPTEESKVVIPAIERPNVDWSTCSRLAEENSDFRRYTKLVRHFHQTGETGPDAWGMPNALEL